MWFQSSWTEKTASATSRVNGNIGNSVFVSLRSLNDREHDLGKNGHVHSFWNVVGHVVGRSRSHWEINTLLIIVRFTRAGSVAVMASVMTSDVTSVMTSVVQWTTAERPTSWPRWWPRWWPRTWPQWWPRSFSGRPRWSPRWSPRPWTVPWPRPRPLMWTQL